MNTLIGNISQTSEDAPVIDGECCSKNIGQDEHLFQQNHAYNENTANNELKGSRSENRDAGMPRTCKTSEPSLTLL